MIKSGSVNNEEIQLYIKDIRKIKVISHERQDEIFEQLKNKDITKEQKHKLHTELVLGNLRFVISIAKGYQNQGLPMPDLINEGNLGLIKAAERFNPSSDNRFISYAVWWIRQSILSALNEHSRMIRLPSNVIQENQKIRKNNDTNVFDQFHIGDEDKNGTIMNHNIVNLSDEINEDGDQLIDMIANLNADNPEDSLNTKEEMKKRVNLMLSVLDEREKMIIENSYGLNGVEMNLETLGEHFGCTKERIRQLRDKAIKKLRNDSYDLIKYL